MKLMLPIETANQIIGYLSTRPYNEVYQLIAAMQDAAKPPVMPDMAPTADQEQGHGG